MILSRTLLLSLCLLLLPACSISIRVGSAPKLQHAVFVWLKDHGNQDQRQRLLDCGAKLRTIPGVCSLSSGTCLRSPRPIVDSTYDVGFIMTFQDADAMRKYLDHPLHKQAVKEVLQPLSSKILVYDFVEP